MDTLDRVNFLKLFLQCPKLSGVNLRALLPPNFGVTCGCPQSAEDRTDEFTAHLVTPTGFEPVLPT